MSKRLAWASLSLAILCLGVSSSARTGPGEEEEASAALCKPVASAATLPRANVQHFGARGNGIDDDSAAIYKAMAALGHGGTVFFPPGIYAHTNVLRLQQANITFAGREAVLYASNPDRAAIVLSAENTAIRDLVIKAPPSTERGDKPEQSGLVLSGSGTKAIRNAISDFKSTGIIVIGATDYVVACNHVSDTLADGIHSTNGAAHGYVAWNHVFNSGDDGIAIVSYADGRQASGVTVENNSVEHIRWGRGISVIGSANVTIRRNRVKAVAMAAGIIVAREASYHTPGAHDVIIDANELFDIQQKIAPLGAGRRTGHGAIELNSDSDDPELAVSGINVVGNKVDGTPYDGIRLLGNVCSVTISSNHLSEIGGRGINVKSRCSRQVVQCNGNSIENSALECD